MQKIYLNKNVLFLSYITNIRIMKVFNYHVRPNLTSYTQKRKQFQTKIIISVMNIKGKESFS